MGVRHAGLALARFLGVFGSTSESVSNTSAAQLLVYEDQWRPVMDPMVVSNTSAAQLPVRVRRSSLCVVWRLQARACGSAPTCIGDKIVSTKAPGGLTVLR